MKEWIKKNWLTLVMILVVSFVSIGVAIYELDFPNRDINATYTMEDDGFAKYVVIKALKEYGLKGMFFIDRLGAPGTSTMVALASNDPILVFTLYILMQFTSTAPATLIVYYILSFVEAALAMYWLSRKMKINPVLSGVLALLFTFTPYHFYRQLIHIILLSIYSIPLGIAIAVYMFMEAGKTIDKDKQMFSKVSIAICAVIIGLSNPYYVFFLMMLFAMAFLLRAITEWQVFKSFKTAVRFCINQLWAPVLTGVCMVSAQLPRFAYGILTHRNLNAMSRSPYESEVYGLKITQMFLPATYHNISKLKEYTLNYWRGTLIITENFTLGFIPAIGVLILIGIFCYQFAKGDHKNTLFNFFAFAVVMYMLIASSGGVGLLFNMIVTPQFRCYNRVCVVICAIGLLVVGKLIQKIEKKKLMMSLTALVFVFGIVDQVPFDPFIKYNPGMKAKDEIYREFFTEIENSLEPGDMVYQLPYVPYPENPPVYNMHDYAQFKGYYYTDTIKWSYGGIKNVDTEAAMLNTHDGMSLGFIEGLLINGFDGVYIDTTAYADGAEELIAYYNDFGIAPIVSGDGLLYFYDIRTIADSIEDAFVQNFLEDISLELSDEELDEMLDGLFVDPVTTTDIIYDIIDDTDIITYEPAEYVEYLYVNFLERDPAESEVANWVGSIESGTTYRDLLYTVIGSPEFSNCWINGTAE